MNTSEMVYETKRMVDRLLKPEEVAALLGISRSLIYHLMQIGEMPSIRIRRVCRVRQQDLEAYIAKNLHNPIR